MEVSLQVDMARPLAFSILFHNLTQTAGDVAGVLSFGKPWGDVLLGWTAPMDCNAWPVSSSA
jgi:hypothetical protein